MTPNSFPLRTERLLLRTHREADAASLQPIYALAEVARFLLDEPWNAETARTKVAERVTQTGLEAGSGAGALALVIEEQGEAIGDVQLWLTDRERGVAEIGWVLDPARGGRGLAAEAVRAVLDLAFTHYGLHRVAAQMDARNLASARLAERVGMRREAHMRQDWWSKGEWTDTVIFGALAADRS